MLVARTNPLLVFHYNFGYIKRCGQYYDENKFNREDLFRHVTEQDSFDNSNVQAPGVTERQREREREREIEREC